MSTSGRRQIIVGLLTWVITLASAAFAVAEDNHIARLGPITVEHVWLRATARPAAPNDVYADLRNAGPADRLVAVEVAGAGAIRFVGYRLRDGAMEALPLPEIELPSRRLTKLTPTTLAIRIEGIGRVFSLGDTLTLRLRFAQAGVLSVTAETMAANARQHSHAGHSH